MSQEHTDLVRSAYEAYNRRDVESVLSCLHPDTASSRSSTTRASRRAADATTSRRSWCGRCRAGKLSALYEQLDTLSMARATEGAPAAA